MKLMKYFSRFIMYNRNDYCFEIHFETKKKWLCGDLDKS